MAPSVRRSQRPRTVRYETAEAFPVRALVQREVKSQPPKPVVEETAERSWFLNPYLAFAALCGIGVATLQLGHPLRLTVLWLALLGLVLLYAQSGRLRADYSMLNLVRGALVGAVVALPFYILARGFFYATASRLYGVQDLQVLLERAVFLVPILEESFFRGIVQREKGLQCAAVTFGLAQFLYFLPLAAGFPLVVGAVAVGMALLGLLYGHMFRRYGLTSSIACHVAVSFVLLVLPPLVDRIGVLFV